jgi:FKBP-type peptidyl-prolyl cis-trans isomerase
MSKAAIREQRRAQRIARRNRQRTIIGIIALLVILLIVYLVYKDYKSRTQAAVTTPATTAIAPGELYSIGTLDTTLRVQSANAITTATGLIYDDLHVGDGTIAKSGDNVTVNYIGWLADGTKFDSSLDSTFGFTLGAKQVIAGWDEGVVGMRINGTRLLVIPPALGYGSTANGSIPANSTLTFEVQLVTIK